MKRFFYGLVVVLLVWCLGSGVVLISDIAREKIEAALYGNARPALRIGPEYLSGRAALGFLGPGFPFVPLSLLWLYKARRRTKPEVEPGRDILIPRVGQ